MIIYGDHLWTLSRSKRYLVSVPCQSVNTCSICICLGDSSALLWRDNGRRRQALGERINRRPVMVWVVVVEFVKNRMYEYSLFVNRQD